MQKAMPKHRLQIGMTDPARERVEEECSSGLYRSGCEPGGRRSSGPRSNTNA